MSKNVPQAKQAKLVHRSCQGPWTICQILDQSLVPQHPVRHDWSKGKETYDPDRRKFRSQTSDKNGQMEKQRWEESEKRREEKRRLAELLRFGAVKFKTWGCLAEEVSQNWFVFKLADRQTGRQADRQTEGQKDRRQTDRQTGRQAGRQTDRQRQIDR